MFFKKELDLVEKIAFLHLELRRDEKGGVKLVLGGEILSTCVLSVVLTHSIS